MMVYLFIFSIFTIGINAAPAPNVPFFRLTYQSQVACDEARKSIIVRRYTTDGETEFNASLVVCSSEEDFPTLISAGTIPLKNLSPAGGGQG